MELMDGDQTPGPSSYAPPRNAPFAAGNRGRFSTTERGILRPQKSAPRPRLGARGGASGTSNEPSNLLFC